MITDPGSGPAVRNRLHIAVLLAIPALVLLRQTNAIFPDPTFTDTWIYLGFFKNFYDFKRYLFTETYYASRLSWILPGWLINRVLSPEVANYLTHLGVFYLLIFSLYSAVSRLAHRRAAFVAALTCGFYPYLWRSVGSDYVDGAGIAYYMASFALLTRAAFSEHRRMALTLAGIFAAATVHTNLFWCVPASLLAAHYCGMVVLRTKTWRRAISDLLTWFTLGFLTLNGCLAAINFGMVGDPWFFLPSIRFLQRYGTVSSPAALWGIRLASVSMAEVPSGNIDSGPFGYSLQSLAIWQPEEYASHPGDRHTSGYFSQYSLSSKAAVRRF